MQTWTWIILLFDLVIKSPTAARVDLVRISSRGNHRHEGISSSPHHATDLLEQQLARCSSSSHFNLCMTISRAKKKNKFDICNSESGSESKGVNIANYMPHGFYHHEHVSFLNIYVLSTSSTLQTTLYSLHFHSCNPTHTQHRRKNPCPRVRHLPRSRFPSRHCLSSLEEWHASY